MTAFVSAPSTIFEGSIVYSDGITSANSGFPPNATNAFAVATNDMDEVRIASPALIPAASNESCIAAVPEFTDTACFTPHMAAKSSSNLNMLSPMVSRSFLRASAAASIIFSVIIGCANGIFICAPPSGAALRLSALSAPLWRGCPP